MCWDQAPDSKPARATPSPGKFLNINRFSVWYHLANPEHVRISVEISGFSAVRWWMRAFAHWVCDGNPSPKIRTSAYSGRIALGRKFGKTHIKLPPLKKKLTWNFLRWTLEKCGPFDHDRDEGLGIVREPLLIISSDRTEFQSFDGLPSHRRNVFPVNLEPIIEHCSVFPRLLNIVPPPSDLEHHHLTAESHSCGDRHNHYYLSYISMSCAFLNNSESFPNHLKDHHMYNVLGGEFKVELRLRFIQESTRSWSYHPDLPVARAA